MNGKQPVGRIFAARRCGVILRFGILKGMGQNIFGVLLSENGIL